MAPMVTTDARTGFCSFRLWHELVTCAAQSKDMHRVVGLAFELLPQSQNVGVDGAGMTIAFVTEDLADKQAAGQASQKELAHTTPGFGSHQREAEAIMAY
jgi:hypothetical protein